jgi:hypothetical protein
MNLSHPSSFLCIFSTFIFLHQLIHPNFKNFRIEKKKKERDINMKEMKRQRRDSDGKGDKDPGKARSKMKEKDVLSKDFIEIVRDDDDI